MDIYAQRRFNALINNWCAPFSVRALDDGGLQVADQDNGAAMRSAHTLNRMNAAAPSPWDINQGQRARCAKPAVAVACPTPTPILGARAPAMGPR
jgi:hypothetical protein